MPPPLFDHERLHVYRSAIAFNAWLSRLLDGPLSTCKLNAVSQLERAASSVPLNIAEGNGKRSAKDRCRFLDIACGSALECAASLDVLVSRRVLAEGDVSEGKEILVGIVKMLARMTVRLLEEHDRGMSRSARVDGR